MSLTNVFARTLWIDALTVIIAPAVVPLGFVARGPWWLVAAAVLTIGFSFGAHFGLMATSALSSRIGIIAGSILLWACCFYAVMHYWLNTFGS